MNCLACQGVVRTNSIEEFGDPIDVPTSLWTIQETDTKTPPPPKPDYGNIMRSASIVGVPRHHNNVPRRCHSTVAASVEDQPKLVRSCGMRRDWSFEDLRKTTLTA